MTTKTKDKQHIYKIVIGILIAIVISEIASGFILYGITSQTAYYKVTATVKTIGSAGITATYTDKFGANQIVSVEITDQDRLKTIKTDDKIEILISDNLRSYPPKIPDL